MHYTVILYLPDVPLSVLGMVPLHEQPDGPLTRRWYDEAASPGCCTGLPLHLWCIPPAGSEGSVSFCHIPFHRQSQPPWRTARPRPRADGGRQRGAARSVQDLLPPIPAEDGRSAPQLPVLTKVCTVCLWWRLSPSPPPLLPLPLGLLFAVLLPLPPPTVSALLLPLGTDRKMRLQFWHKD